MGKRGRGTYGEARGRCFEMFRGKRNGCGMRCCVFLTARGKEKERKREREREREERNELNRLHGVGLVHSMALCACVCVIFVCACTCACMFNCVSVRVCVNMCQQHQGLDQIQGGCEG